MFQFRRNDEKAEQITFKKSPVSITKPVFKDISSKSQKQLNGYVPNGQPNNQFTSALSNGPQFNGPSHENKSEDGNLSIPHMADLYPEGMF